MLKKKTKSEITEIEITIGENLFKYKESGPNVGAVRIFMIFLIGALAFAFIANASTGNVKSYLLISSVICTLFFCGIGVVYTYFFLHHRYLTHKKEKIEYQEKTKIKKAK